MNTILGQPRALAQLQRSLRSGRLGHTFIFAGPAGVGKFKTAIELAKTELCDRRQEKVNGGVLPSLGEEFLLTLPCNQCESCRAVENRTHPDLHVVTKELIRYHDKGGKSKGTTIGIDVIRGEITGSNDADHPVEAKIYKRPFRGPGKWFIIDEAELMLLPAQNSLLKTLEEPPAHSFLVLVTTSPGELLQTIRSRSQLVEFGELPRGIIMDGLIGHGVGSEDAQLLARLAHGSLGKAVRWAEDRKLIGEKLAAAANRKAARGKEEDEEEGSGKEGISPEGMAGWVKHLAGVLDAFVAGRAAASEVAGVIQKNAADYAAVELMHDPLTSKDRAVRDGVGLMLGVLAEWFDDRLRLAIGSPTATPLPGEAGGVDPEVVGRVVAIARGAEGQIDQNVHVGLLLSSATTAMEEALRAAVV